MCERVRGDGWRRRWALWVDERVMKVVERGREVDERVREVGV